MNRHEHLPLPIFKAPVERQKQGKGGSGYNIPEGRSKSAFSKTAAQKVDTLVHSFKELKRKLPGNIKPSLIYEIEINQSVSSKEFENRLASMGIQVISFAENKKGYWVVFSDDEELSKFKKKLIIYGSDGGAKYDFFHAIESFRDIPGEEKIGKALREKPIGETPEFIDIELWKMRNPQKNEDFIKELEEAYPDRSIFKITDKLVTKSFVLLRVKLTGEIFNGIIELKEIARTDYPSLPTFNKFDFRNIDISKMEVNAPDESAAGILIIDSGIISNHPLLEKCVGSEENFQNGEQEVHDTVGHGTAVAGCAAYNDIETCIREKLFNPSNWIFSAKVMYAEKNYITGPIVSVYDAEKLIEHQFKDAVESFLSNPEYDIKVVNISLGNKNEVWHKDYSRQLPLAALIDELAYTYPGVTFIVSAGNNNPCNVYENIREIKDNYPGYLLENEDFKITNPATSALAITVGSIAGEFRIQEERYGSDQIKTPIAKKNQPSPFSRTGQGINGMVKPELVEYGGNQILYESYNRIVEDDGGKVTLLNNQSTGNILKFDYGTSFSAPKVAHLAGRIANKFPQKSANFIHNMLLIGADYPFEPYKTFYNKKDNDSALKTHLSICGYGLSGYDRAVNSFDNRAILFDEGQIGLNRIKIYSLKMPDIFFAEAGKKKITITLTFNPETRSSRGDSYLGNRMKFQLSGSSLALRHFK